MLKPKKTITYYYQLLTKICSDIKQSFLKLFVFDAFCKIIIFIIYAPLTGWIFTKLISFSGSGFIDHNNFVKFVLTPEGIITIILWSTFGVAIYHFQLAGIITIAINKKAGERIKLVHIFGFIIKRFPKIIELSLRQCLTYLLYISPFAIIAGLIFILISSEYDLEYLAVNKPPIFWLGIFSGALLITGLLYLLIPIIIRWQFSLPILLFQDHKPKQALKKSAQLSKKFFWKISLAILGWGVLSTLFFIIFTVSFYQNLVFFIIKNLKGNFLTLPIIALLIIIYFLLIAFFSFIAFTVNSLIIFHLYLEVLSFNKIQLPFLLERNKTFPKYKTPIPLKFLFLFIAALLITALLVIVNSLKNINLDYDITITAHRANTLNAPENTLSAINQAIKEGTAQYAEIDVQETKDGIVVVLHDENLLRTTGYNKNIWEINYDELETLDAGSWFSPEFSGERVPKLDDAVKLAKGKIKLNIELKINGHGRQLPESVVKIIEDNDFENEVFVSSYGYNELLKVKNLNSDIATAFMILESIGSLDDIKTPCLSLSGEMFSDKSILSLKNNKYILVWTIDKEKDMKHYIDLQVNNIITNNPVLLKQVLAEKQSQTYTEKLLSEISIWFNIIDSY